MATTLEIVNASRIATLLNPPMVNLSGTPTLASNVSTYFALALNTRLSGSGPITWSSGSNPSRVTAIIPGTYAIAGTLNWPGTLGNNIGRAQIEINGSGTNTKFTSVPSSSGNISATCSGLEVLNAGDYLEVYGNQASGSTITLANLRLCVWLVSAATS